MQAKSADGNSRAAMTRLANIAEREAARLAATEEDARKEAMHGSRDQRHPAKRAVTSKKGKLRGKALKAHLAEAERLRVRSEYREQQLKRIASQASPLIERADQSISSD